jgi:hypothetical protein
LSEENQICFQHFKECKVTGQWPDDAVVRRNAALIQEVIDDCEKYQLESFRKRMIGIGEALIHA